MKKSRVLILVSLFVMPLFMGTGCQMMSDLWPFGSGVSEPEGIPVPAEDLPGDWGEPGAPVGDRAEGEWKHRDDLKLPTIYFSYDKFSIGTREQKILDKVAKYMQSNPSLGLIVEGHCDKRGSDEYNRALGERRALAVQDYLTNLGVSASRIRTQSYGEERPAVQGEDESAFSKNRRAELILADMK